MRGIRERPLIATVVLAAVRGRGLRWRPVGQRRRSRRRLDVGCGER